VDGSYHIVITVIAQSLSHDLLEYIFLLARCYRKRSAKDVTYEAVVKLLRLFGVVQNVVDIRAPVDKCREQEAYVRHVDHPVADSVVECAFNVEVAESRLGQVDVANGAHDIVIHLV